LFQLRSIEQNELAIMADNQNKAIFVFTGVTIVFLPLSFFTSYYGMNLEGILNSTRTEAYFWKICGSSAFVIILIVCLYAFRYHIRQIIWASLQGKRVNDG
jgi:Mg2+ and Co2+ transporter CorA